MSINTCPCQARLRLFVDLQYFESKGTEFATTYCFCLHQQRESPRGGGREIGMLSKKRTREGKGENKNESERNRATETQNEKKRDSVRGAIEREEERDREREREKGGD